MKKSVRVKYTLLLIIYFIFVISNSLIIFTRNLNKTEGEMVSFVYFLSAHASNCSYQAKEGYSWYWPNCQNATLGKYYTIIGRVKGMSDKSNSYQLNIGVSSITENSEQEFSEFGIFASIYGKILMIEENLGGMIKSLLQRYLSRDNASLVLGLTLGSQFAGFTADFKALIKSLGLSHMVAVSGFHLGLIYLLCSAILDKLLTKNLSVFLTIILLIWYCWLVSSPLSLLRALIMLFFSLIGRTYLRKQVNSCWFLFLAFLLMSLYSVKNIFNAGFQLSVLATAGILIFGGLDVANMDKLRLSLSENTMVEKLRAGVNSIKASILTSVAAQLASLPVLIAVFGEVCPWGILSSLLFSTVITFVVTLSVPLIVIALILREWMDYLGWLITPYFAFLDDLVSWLLASMRFFAQYFGVLIELDWKSQWWWWIVYYSILLIWASGKNWWKNRGFSYV